MFICLGRRTQGFGAVEVSEEVVEVGVKAEAEVVGGGGEEEDEQGDPGPSHPHHHLGHFLTLWCSEWFGEARKGGIPHQPHFLPSQHLPKLFLVFCRDFAGILGGD